MHIIFRNTYLHYCLSYYLNIVKYSHLLDSGLHYQKELMYLNFNPPIPWRDCVLLYLRLQLDREN